MANESELNNNERRHIAALREEGVPVGRIAERFVFCRQTVYRVCRRKRDTGNTDKVPRSGHLKKPTPIDCKLYMTLCQDGWLPL